jgi:hypothetical protein
MHGVLLPKFLVVDGIQIPDRLKGFSSQKSLTIPWHVALCTRWQTGGHLLL